MPNQHRLPVTINPEGTRCVPVFLPNDDEWIRHFVEAVHTLVLDRRWERDDAKTAVQVRRKWYDITYAPLIAALASGLGCSEGTPESGECVEYPPYADFIEWFPQNPFTQPFYKPDGYLDIPFRTYENVLPNWIPEILQNLVEELLPEWLSGYKQGDVFSFIGSFPLPLNIYDIASWGFPRFRVHFHGKGTVELHLLTVPFGGRAIITLDTSLDPFYIWENPLSIINLLPWQGGLDIAETARDVLSIPPEAYASTIVEVEVPTEGDHFIEVLFFPAIQLDGLSLDSFGMGGGLRKVVLCGLTPQGIPEPPEPPEPPEGTEFIELATRFRFTSECGLEYQNYRQDTNAIIVDWTPVTGWVDNAAACFQNPFPIVEIEDCTIRFDMDADSEFEQEINVADCINDALIEGVSENNYNLDNLPLDHDGKCATAYGIVDEISGLLQRIDDAVDAFLTVDAFAIVALRRELLHEGGYKVFEINTLITFIASEKVEGVISPTHLDWVANRAYFVEVLYNFNLSQAALALVAEDEMPNRGALIVNSLLPDKWNEFAYMGRNHGIGGACFNPDAYPECLDWEHLVGTNWEVSLVNLGTVEVAAAIDDTFGNNAPSVKAGFVNSGANYGRDVTVRIAFDEPMRVTSASMQYWYNDGGNNAAVRRIQLYAPGLVLLAENIINSNDAPKSTWTDHSWTGDVSGVYHIDFLIRHFGTNTAIFNSGSTSAWIDNVCVEVEPVSDDFTPIVDWTGAIGCESGHGTAITDLGAGYWSITSVGIPTIEEVSFKDIYGREFAIDDISFTSSVGMYYGGDSVAGGCRQETYNWYAGVELTACNFARNGSAFTVTFHAILV